MCGAHSHASAVLSDFSWTALIGPRVEILPLHSAIMFCFVFTVFCSQKEKLQVALSRGHVENLFYSVVTEVRSFGLNSIS